MIVAEMLRQGRLKPEVSANRTAVTRLQNSVDDFLSFEPNFQTLWKSAMVQNHTNVSKGEQTSAYWTYTIK
tara:strand:- start:2584 stop:2796 length:213 start_codon:yes stop_codon:yes gene_type:complete